MSKSASGPIPFNRPSMQGKEWTYLQEALERGHYAGDGPFTKRCHTWLEQSLGSSALLTHSCTAALEMSALLSDIGPGDEVIMPSFTFVSTANAVALRGGVPVFVNVHPGTMNIDERELERAITPKTKAIFVVHYAGVAAEMDSILAIAKAKNLIVLEDAAQALLSKYRGRPLGTLGSLGSLSFHETKNVVSGEGGALIINDPKLKERAEIIREKGTNRSQFFRGQVDKYTWVDLGSSFLPSELLAAVLLAQLESARTITDARLKIWAGYHESFKALEERGIVQRPVVPAHCESNGHIYFLLTSSLDERTALMEHLKSAGVASTFHYVPLHNSPAGKKFGRTSGDLSLTVNLSDRLVRLPVWATMSSNEQERVSDLVLEFYKKR
jgi:dTDP-4-amino-4,6-dideoxygalactose transaminase